MEENQIFENRIDLSKLNQAVEAIKGEIGKIIVGKNNVIDLLITALLANGHVLIEGVPGVAKTMMAKLLAKTIDADFSRIQFTPDLMPSDILGTAVYNFQTSNFDFKSGPIFSNLILIDEINRSPAKTQAALFETMEERQATIDGKTYKLEEPFMVLATQNPIEHEGTYKLPEAQLDRFIFKINVDYPTLEEETEIISRFHQLRNKVDFEKIISYLSKQDLATYKKQVTQIHIEPNLIKYIAELTNATRNTSDLYIGASPRASLAILSGSKAFAAINNRDFVTPEDIKYIASPVLLHRVSLSAEKEMEGFKAIDVINELIQSVEVPR